MPPFAFHTHLLTQHSLPPPEAHALLQSALALRDAERAGQPRALLRGKNIAILGTSADPATASGTLAEAATRLGARVACIRPDDALLAGDDAATAKMLARLYDAVAVEAVDGEVALRLQRDTGLPVFENLGRPDHPMAAQLLPAMDGAAGQADADNRRYLVQALLLASLA
jgi:ornithine carbamoyltransferase